MAIFFIYCRIGYLQVVCVEVLLLNCMNCAGASAISEQLTWDSYVLYACPYSVSIMISVQPVGKCLFPQLSLFHSVSIQFLHMLWIKWV